LPRRTCATTSDCAARVPYLTVASNSVDRLIRLRAGSTAKNLTLRSGRQRAAALTAPVGHDRTPRAGPHPQAEAVHAGSAPVIRLEGPLALGHGVLLVVSRSSFPSHPAARVSQLRCFVGRSDVVLLLAGAVPKHINLGRSRIADFRATVRGY
jgi:hypothetical protein